MEIKTTEQITMALLKGVPERAEKSGMKRGKQLYRDLVKIKWVAVDDLIKEIDKHSKCTEYHKVGNLNLTCLDIIKGELLNKKIEEKH